MKRSTFSDEQILAILGKARPAEVADPCRAHGTTEQTITCASGRSCRPTRTASGTCSCSFTAAPTSATRIGSAPITWWERFHRSRSPPRRPARRGFVNTDIPALTSGNMIPTPTVRYPGTLRASNLAASRMSDSHDLDSSLTKTVHDEERKVVQENPLTVFKIGSTRLRTFRNPLYGRIEFTAKARSSSFVALPVPPLGGFGLVSCQRMTSTANCGISAR